MRWVVKTKIRRKVNMEKLAKNKWNLKEFVKENSPMVALVVLFILAVVLEGTTFLNLNNLINILLNNAIIGIISLGMMLIIITAGIDLSVGSMLAAIGLITIYVLNQTNSILLAFGAAIVSGAVLGALTGVLVAQFAIPAFIVTLGTMRIYRSLAQYALNGGGSTTMGSASDSFISIANTSILGIPVPVWIWILTVLVISLLTKKTAFGRHVYAVGSNERATFLAGINVKKILILVYAVAGVLVAIAAILEASRLGSMNSSSSGLNYEMDAIAATVIGGTAMMGGRGSVSGTVFGTLTLGIINNLMNLMGMPSFLVGTVKGLIIIVAVLMQKALDRKGD